MKDYTKDFLPFDGNVWLNAASEGPLPKVSARALEEAVVWKSLPYLLNPKFSIVPRELKKSIGKLINVHPRDVILSNSATYGLHILADGIPWNKGDEILLMENDFPSDILPWLALEHKEVKVKQIKPRNKVLTAEELSENISDKTRLFCISQVHTFTGFILEIEEFAKICKERKIIFVLNLSQSAGCMPIDLTHFPVDAVVCAGYKWLLGPYGTGFCWIKPELRKQLHLNRAYWISTLSEVELEREGPLQFKELTSARKYDIFGTANFFNFVPFKTSIDYILDIGLENIIKHNNHLVDFIIQNIHSNYIFVSPQEGNNRSSLVVISHKQPQKNSLIFKSLHDRDVYPAFWRGNIRLAPHIYNTESEVEKVLEILAEIGG